jgi:hypothetical protein
MPHKNILSTPLKKEKTSFFDILLAFSLVFSCIIFHQPKKSGTREPKDGVTMSEFMVALARPGKT